MLVDANLLVYAVNRASPFHGRARPWLEEQLAGPRRVGLPWESLTALVRLVTDSRVVPAPLPIEEAWRAVEALLAAPATWTPTAGPGHAGILGSLVVEQRITRHLISDAHLAAIAIEHGLAVASADSDFARFPDARWFNPLAA